MFDKPTAISRAMIGAVAGFFIGLFALIFLENPEPGDLRQLLVWVCLGIVLGATTSMLAGRRSVPVFWAYFVVAFGAIALIPWVEGKGSGTYPLGTLYVNRSMREGALFVFLLHASASVAVAAIASRVHKKTADHFSQRPEGERRAVNRPGKS